MNPFSGSAVLNSLTSFLFSPVTSYTFFHYGIDNVYPTWRGIFIYLLKSLIQSAIFIADISSVTVTEFFVVAVTEHFVCCRIVLVGIVPVQIYNCHPVPLGFNGISAWCPVRCHACDAPLFLVDVFFISMASWTIDDMTNDCLIVLYHSSV